MQLRTDRSLIRAAGESRRYLLLTFEAPAGGITTHRPPVNIALVLDRSGSMSGAKIELVRVAANRALQMLNPEDRFSLVVFDDQIDVLVESCPASVESIRRADALLRGTDARNMTDLFTGWMKGCEQIAATATHSAMAKCLLLTDGLANQGVTDASEIARHADRLRELGVRTSTFGVGEDFDEVLLDRMAKSGGGQFYFIEKPQDIPDFMASELGETLEVVASDVRLELDLPAGARAEMLSDLAPVARTRNAWRVGDLVASQQVSILVAVTFGRGDEGEEETITARVAGADAAEFNAQREITWKFASHRENDRQRRDVEVDRVVAAAYAARARHEALDANRKGDYQKARSVFRATAARIRSYANSDRILLETAASLENDQPMYEVEMASVDRKRRHYASANLLRHRDPNGRARRGPSQ